MTREPYYILPGKNGFKGALLDEYLATGHYRMLHMVFTTNKTEMEPEGGSVAVFWLRTLVNKISQNRTTAAIIKKCSHFKVEYKKACITSEIEDLYSRYHGQLDFVTADSCRGCLHDSFIENPFDSKMVLVRDGKALIATGYFDAGKNAIAGILNFYHPDYKKYSLGKFLMLKKIAFAIENNMQFYYTGYISTGVTKFDYKLFPDVNAIEVYLPDEKQWLFYNCYGKDKLKLYSDTRFL